MATGEGKTLVGTLPVFLNALTGNGVHVVTVNDYLAKRDSEWMGPLYMFHGLSVDCIDKHQPNSESRRRAYQADITFGTNNEFGFDYLRDNMAMSPKDLVQRRHNYAIVDEVDSVLIDDARTPLFEPAMVMAPPSDTLTKGLIRAISATLCVMVGNSWIRLLLMVSAAPFLVALTPACAVITTSPSCLKTLTAISTACSISLAR